VDFKPHKTCLWGEIYTYLYIIVSLISSWCGIQHNTFLLLRDLYREERQDFVLFPMQIFEINKHMENKATVLQLENEMKAGNKNTTKCSFIFEIGNPFSL